jgi:hypothetical protein
MNSNPDASSLSVPKAVDFKLIPQLYNDAVDKDSSNSEEQIIGSEIIFHGNR